MDVMEFIKWFTGTIFYSFLGISIMLISSCLLEKFTKFSIKKELVEDENIAIGVMFAWFFIAVAIIIAAAIV